MKATVWQNIKRKKKWIINKGKQSKYKKENDADIIVI